MNLNVLVLAKRPSFELNWILFAKVSFFLHFFKSQKSSKYFCTYIKFNFKVFLKLKIFIKRIKYLTRTLFLGSGVKWDITIEKIVPTYLKSNKIFQIKIWFFCRNSWNYKQMIRRHNIFLGPNNFFNFINNIERLYIKNGL